MLSSSRWSGAEALAAVPSRWRGAALALLAAACLPAGAAESDAARVPPALRALVPQAAMVGTGRFSWYGLHVYDARLFAPVPFDASGWHGRPLALELTYARGISAARIAQSTHDELARLGVGNAAQRERWRNDLERLIPDVRAGMRLTGLYQPDEGARFFADGTPLGGVDDPQFARGFFMIWLDPRTRSPQLRAGLIGDAHEGGRP